MRSSSSDSHESIRYHESNQRREYLFSPLNIQPRNENDTRNGDQYEDIDNAGHGGFSWDRVFENGTKMGLDIIPEVLFGHTNPNA